MPTANEELLDRSVAHAVDLERFKSHAQQKIRAILNRARDDLKQQINVTDREDLYRRLEALVNIEGKAHNESWKYLNSQLEELADIEGAFWINTLTTALPVAYNFIQPAGEHIYAAAMARPFQGRVLAEWAQTQEADAMRKVRDAIRLGFVEGESIPEITRRIVGTRAMGYKDGVLEISRRNATAVVRSAVSHTAAMARERSFEANSDIVSKVYWNGTLDGRTTQVCRARDGKEYTTDGKPIGHTLPWLGGPGRAHWQCRSVSVPGFDDETVADLIGERPQVTDTRTRRVREIDFRAQAKAEAGEEWSALSESARRKRISEIRRKWTRDNVGTAPASTTYEQWLRRQDRSMVEDILGKQKAALFLDGKVSIDKFSDRRGGELTLAQLRQRIPGAFEKIE